MIYIFPLFTCCVNFISPITLLLASDMTVKSAKQELSHGLRFQICFVIFLSICSALCSRLDWMKEDDYDDKNVWLTYPWVTVSQYYSHKIQYRIHSQNKLFHFFSKCQIFDHKTESKAKRTISFIYHESVIAVTVIHLIECITVFKWSVCVQTDVCCFLFF